MLRGIKGQSTLEYIVIVTAIVAAIILGAKAITDQKKAVPDSGLGKLMYQTKGSIEGASGRVSAVIPSP